MITYDMFRSLSMVPLLCSAPLFLRNSLGKYNGLIIFFTFLYFIFKGELTSCIFHSKWPNGDICDRLPSDLYAASLLQ